MVRSMYSGVSGLRTHQTRMDVIGNNIANVNTYGFKASRATFRDIYYQTLQGATAPGKGQVSGGTNPNQVGYGVAVNTIDKLMTQSGFAFTDNPLDVAIDGEGFITLESPSGEKFYTRAGILDIDADGNLVDGNGNFVLGNNSVIEIDANAANKDDIIKTKQDDMIQNAQNADTQKINVLNGITITGADAGKDKVTMGDFKSISISKTGEIIGNLKKEIKAGPPPVFAEGIVKMGRISTSVFENPKALNEAGSNYFMESINSGVPKAVIPSLAAGGAIVSGALELSNVDLSKEFSDMITTQRGFQANSRIITVSDEMLQELVNLKR